LRRYLRASGPVARPEILARYAFDGERLDAALGELMAERQIVAGRFAARQDDVGGSAAGDQSAAATTPIAGAIQYCDRDLLARIRRRTIALLRRAVQPVPLATYADFLARWTSGSSLRGVMAQLAGVALPGPVWERDVLPGRLPDFQGDELAALCQAGELVWAAAGRDPRRGHVRFFGRGQGGLYLGPPEEGGLSEPAQAAYAFLRSEGASFMADLQAGLGMRPPDVQAALVELALAGLATNDTLDALHAILAFQPAVSADKTPFSSLEADLAGRLPPRPLTRNRYRAAKQEAARRVERMTATDALWPGRWSLVHRVAVLGPPLSDAARSEGQARVLLARYGVIAREVMERETGPFDWALIYAQFQRMELRGELRRGYFVAGLSGVQYALPQAVERLRAAGEEDTPIVLNATDPANLYGGEGLGDAPAFARLPSTHVVLVRGRPILVAQDGGERMVAAARATEDELRRALQTYLARAAAPRRVFVAEWNGAPALDGPAEALLRGLGFHRTPTGLERWEAR
jgi:ATP-dependent Lhr-like helicase